MAELINLFPRDYFIFSYASNIKPCGKLASCINRIVRETNFTYADDTTLIAKTAAELQDQIDRIKRTSEEYGLCLDVRKTNVTMSGGVTDQQLQDDGEDIEVVKTFNFLRSLIVSDGGSSQEIKRRLAKARSAAFALTDIMEGQRNF
ncbi:uncharacterized protein LOC119734536 [Patiria miniata]|uniref:Reverse transcriptase domain-containing protein n=1 Tax=Patiria miniata TaxID=46514 RepID=A0A914AKA5_PATMI|nr:uncharacterized protein LOC119734536 [Patiria miniata]